MEGGAPLCDPDTTAIRPATPTPQPSQSPAETTAVVIRHLPPPISIGLAYGQ